MAPRIFFQKRPQLTDWLLLAAACAAFQLPFINKALQADSDLLVHAARMTAHDPLSPPLGEYGRHMAMYNIHTGMPPASLYYRCPHGPLLPFLLAPVAKIAGNAQWPFHLALLPFSIAAVLGCYFLLLLFTHRTAAFFASALMAGAPVFVVSGTNIMWDVPVFAFMIWSLGLLMSGVRRGSVARIAISGALIGCAVITKMSALPLLGCEALWVMFAGNRRFLSAWVIPAAVLPFAWAAHNAAIFHTIQFLSTNHLNLLPADIRYKLERFVIYLGSMVAFPLVWWLIARRLRIAASIAVAGSIGGFLWGAAIHVVLQRSVWYAVACVFFGITGAYAAILTAKKLARSDTLAFSGRERFLVCGFCCLYCGFLIIVPAAEPRFILPLLPFLVLPPALYADTLAKNAKRVFITALSAGQILLTLAVAYSDALTADSDRRLPDLLRKLGYGPCGVGYCGRLQFDFYLHQAGYAMIGLDTAPACTLRAAVETRIPSDLSVSGVLPKTTMLTLVDTIAVHRFPVRVCPPGCGLYGEDRLPYTLNFQLPLKSYSIFKIDGARLPCKP